MNILYGLSGEGLGHSSRALVIAKYLQEKGHNILLLTYGQAYNVLKDDFKIFKVKGLHLIFEKSVLSKRILFNLRHFSKNFLRFKEFHKIMKEFKPDLCISDMELIVPILSNWYDVPLVCIDNQHRLTNLKLNVPNKYKKDFFLAKVVTETFVRKADYYIVTSFANSKILKKNTFIVSPIVRQEVRKLKPVRKNKILIYLTKKDKHILSVLKSINENFCVYGYNVNKNYENIEFKTKEFFLKDLEDCKAVIATSGFTLMSEALYLKKPFFALPLKGHFEQTLNALFLKQARFGGYSENLKKQEVEDFLKNLKKYENNLKNYKMDFNKLFNKLDFVLNKVKVN